MREYIQEWEKGNEKRTMYFDFNIDEYVIEGYAKKTYYFTDIYEANKFMESNGWK